MLSQIQIRHAAGALEARHTIRVMVEVKIGQTFDPSLEAVIAETEVIDLLLPDDGKPCEPKVRAYVQSEFPKATEEDFVWWTPLEAEAPF
jgi:hypothetical protein